MRTEQKIKHLAELGDILTDVSENLHNNKYSLYIKKAQDNNAWFTDDSVSLALSEIGGSLNKDNLNKWLESYEITNESSCEKTIGLVLAGNIPLVGFHDILSSILTNNRVLIKLSSKDESLYKMIYTILTKIEPKYKHYINFTESQLKDIDAIIATGSNNSARYFEHYFSKYPHIIRKNRNSIAVLNGNDSEQDYIKLSNDIFTYFGLGCRNVSFLLVPQEFDFEMFLSKISQNKVMENTKYANNYNYQRAILMMGQIPFYDSGNLLLKKADTLFSPIATLNYLNYKTNQELNSFIDSNKNNIQCVVSNEQIDYPTVLFGEAQNPKLWDYADNIDTIKFLIGLNSKK